MSTESDLSESEGGTKKRITTKSTDTSASGEDSEVEYTSTEYLDPEYTKKLRSSGKNKEQVSEAKSAKSPVRESTRKAETKRKKKDTMRVWSSAEDGEDDDTDFCPKDLKIMGATTIGAIGIGCLKITENERKNSPNINGAVSGIMKRKIRRAADVINTLIYKAESKGDPTYLRIRNRELESQVEKMKLEEILRNREMEDMRTIVADLKKEVYELNGRLDDAEEDARKARESYRITRRIMKKGEGDSVEVEGDSLPSIEAPPSIKEVDVNIPVDWDLFEDPTIGF
ncbi:myosin heavy chain-like protein [Lasius niger]|uniref:Myosin heavy chain-like protein n=1 Tax=Lasius niger TaxID=67767 RepID=A0A0J7KC77_LASNI|nr:myosin heavy chain-like protein [Lasius niger]